MTSEETQYDPLIQRALGGEEAALAELFDRHRGCLETMVVLPTEPQSLMILLDCGDMLKVAQRVSRAVL